MSTACVLVGAMLLDAALGEPRWLWQRLPHPAVLMGRVIGLADARFNTGEASSFSDREPLPMPSGAEVLSSKIRRQQEKSTTFSLSPAYLRISSGRSWLPGIQRLGYGRSCT